MLETLAPIFDNVTVLRVHSLLGFALLALFFLYAFSKEGRDERGRKNHRHQCALRLRRAFCRDESARLFLRRQRLGPCKSHTRPKYRPTRLHVCAAHR